MDIPQASQHNMEKNFHFPQLPVLFPDVLKGKKSPQLASLYFLSQVSSINTVLLVGNMVVISDFSPLIRLPSIAGFQVIFLLYLIWYGTIKGVLLKHFGIKNRSKTVSEMSSEMFICIRFSINLV